MSTAQLRRDYRLETAVQVQTAISETLEGEAPRLEQLYDLFVERFRAINALRDTGVGKEH
jgi:hypothetical protein